MTAVVGEDPRLHTLRTLLRGLPAFRAYRDSDNIVEIIDDNGRSWSIFDIEAVYAYAMREPTQIGPFVSVAQAVRPGWLVKHTGVWMPVVSVAPHPTRPDVVILTMPEDRIKRRPREMPMACLTPNRWRLMQKAKAEPVLPLRQRQAIDLYLVRNLPEKDVVAAMGIKPDNPIRMYATTGLLTLLKWMDEGRLVSPFADDQPFDSLARAS